MSLAELFPDEDYRFHMRFQRAAPQEFFGATHQHQAIISERRAWLESSPQTCVACPAECDPLIEETIEMAHQCHAFSAAEKEQILASGSTGGCCIALGQVLEPDFLLLKADAAGDFRLLGGCVCFPSSWSLAEKVGRPLEFIHGVVPGLNPQIGKPIQTFLSRLAHGTAWLRHNWGLSRSPELNQHPGRNLPRLSAGARLDEVWLRVERQALVRLPRSEGVLFGIRIDVHALSAVKNEPLAARRLTQALKTMPAEMAAYKNLAAVRHTIVALLSN